MSQGDDNFIHSNYTGNSHKSLHLSVEASLKKLKTDYIDLVWFPEEATIPDLHDSTDSGPSFTCTGGTSPPQ